MGRLAKRRGQAAPQLRWEHRHIDVPKNGCKRLELREGVYILFTRESWCPITPATVALLPPLVGSCVCVEWRSPVVLRRPTSQRSPRPLSRTKRA